MIRGTPEQAVALLQGIKEADAVPALAKAFKAVPDEAERLLYITIISKIGGDKPLQPLILQSLWDESNPVREAAINGVRNRDIDKALPAYFRGRERLRSSSTGRGRPWAGEE